MTILLISTSRRHVPATEPSGFLYTVDYEAGEVLRRSTIIEPPYREVDTNPRGGMRGSKGISVRPDQIAIANSTAIFRYDPQWSFLGVITHPSCAGIHDIVFQGDTLWAASARNDLLMQFDLSGNLLRYLYSRQPSPVRRTLRWEPPILLNDKHIRQGDIDFRDPRTHELETYNSAHVNSMCILPDGDLLVSLGLVVGSEFVTLLRLKKSLMEMGLWDRLLALSRWMRSALGLKKKMHSDLVVQPIKGKSAVVRLTPQGRLSLCLELLEMSVPSHSLLSLADNTVVYLNTTDGAVVHFEPQEGKVLSSTKVTEGFLRGVTAISPQILLMGSKCEVLSYLLPERRVVSALAISADPNESVYDIKVLPPHYAIPPVSFIEHYEKIMGYRDLVAIIHESYQLSEK